MSSPNKNIHTAPTACGYFQRAEVCLLKILSNALHHQHHGQRFHHFFSELYLTQSVCPVISFGNLIVVLWLICYETRVIVQKSVINEVKMGDVTWTSGLSQPSADINIISLNLCCMPCSFCCYCTCGVIGIQVTACT